MHRERAHAGGGGKLPDLAAVAVRVWNRVGSGFEAADSRAVRSSGKFQYWFNGCLD